MDAREQIGQELQALHNANLGLDPLLVAIETHDRVAAHECVQQLIDLHQHGQTLDDQARGYVLVPFRLLTKDQRDLMWITGSLSFINAAD